MSERRQIIILILISIIGVAVAAYLFAQRGEMPEDKPPQVVTAVKVGGPFELVDHYGKIVTQEDYKDKYKLIFFGFTNCPGICPAELQKMASILDALGEKGKDIQPLFISIDPDRDTPDEMRNYVQSFHERLIGLTGTPEQIEKVKKDYKVYASKVQNAAMGEGNYMMDHVAFMYLMDKDNGLALVFEQKDTVPEIVKEITAEIP